MKYESRTKNSLGPFHLHPFESEQIWTKSVIKTNPCALESKYNAKTEFGIRRNTALLVCWAKESAAGSGLQKLQALPEEGAGGGKGYKEIGSSPFLQELLSATSPSSCLQGGTVSRNKRLGRKEEGSFGKERKEITLKWSFTKALVEPF